MIARSIALPAALLAAFFLLTGCELIKAAEEPTDLYQVTPKSTFEPDMPSVQWQLTVEVPAAAANLNTGRIAIAQTPTSSDYYAKTAWTDRAPAMVQTRIVDSFENSHKIVAVSRESIGMRADYTLQPDLRNFEAMYFYGGAPIAHVRVVAKLVRMPERQIIGTATIERCVRARQDKIPKVVEAFDQALGSVIKSLVAWTLKTPPRGVPAINASYDINKYRNPQNEYVDIKDCPVRNDASMVPITDE
jgi:cholesterol transport system auxiliary component